MPTIGFPVPQKENELRRVLLPQHFSSCSHAGNLIFEVGYGEPLGYSDEQYEAAGAQVGCREAVCDCPIICSPKPVLTDEYFRPRKVLFGWIHAVQGLDITDLLLKNRMTAIAWEDMFENARHIFWRNNELSGEAAVTHAALQWGRVLYGSRAAVIGRGNTAKGALRALERAGCDATVYNRKTSHLLRNEIGQYDIIVNAVLWDVFRTDHLVYEEDLAKMKPASLIIDVSCDVGMGVETSRPTTIPDPVYWVKGILHYAVDHTPAIYFRTASECIGEAVRQFIKCLAEGERSEVLENATIIREGRILDDRITRFQKR